MRILTYNDIYSLSKRRYLNYELRDGKITNLPDIDTSELRDHLTNLSKYNIAYVNYIYLLSGLDSRGKKQLLRFIYLQWHNVASSLGDIQMPSYGDLTILDFCDFFLCDEKGTSHRIYFFIEILYQYFFP